MNFNEMLRQANKMQQEMKNAQDKLESQEFEISSGGGAVKVVITGSNEIKSVQISKDIIDPDDQEMLQDVIAVAINEALTKVKEESDKITSKITNGMNFPGF